MKVGVALNMLCQAGRPDASVVGEHLALGDLAEPLGFDSLFALEHHFTGYAMSPAPPQLLSYYAGRTRRITLGTAVIVLPWHDPIRVAEQIALLDVLCGGRCLFGFGRGAASVEYAGFRVPMEEARPRFVEAAQIVVKARLRLVMVDAEPLVVVDVVGAAAAEPDDEPPFEHIVEQRHLLGEPDRMVQRGLQNREADRGMTQ